VNHQWYDHPLIFEINAAVWVGDLGRRLGTAVDLGTVPRGAWDEILPPGADAVWLMGVWERSPAGVSLALKDEGLWRSFRDVLPDVDREDVIGSPYCVRRYEVDAALGGEAGLAAARRELHRRGLRLVLDYVPNHVAVDHPWTKRNPDYFIRGSAEDLVRSPEAFLQVDEDVFARGRDPYFPPWPDVLQLNAFDPGLRAAAVATLDAIGERADGVRCDMAMLMLNDVFGGTWGQPAGRRPEADFWPEVIAGVRDRHPHMCFIAEAYWDKEWVLQQQGFDFCYDKRLYDRLIDDDADSVRAHLGADTEYQRHLLRFLENHDEPSAAASMAPARERAAALLIMTLPGAVLWHEGQSEGNRLRLPVFLGRRAPETTDTALSVFHTRLLQRIDNSGLRNGAWRLLAATGWPDNQSWRHLLTWSWEGPQARHVVVINFSDQPAQGRVALPWPDLGGRTWRLRDVMADERVFDRDGTELVSPGLFVSLEPWDFYVLAVDTVGA
jgi:Alpha amylase, catalytic domain